MTGDVAFVVAASVVAKLSGLEAGLPFLVVVLGDAPVVLGCNLVREGRHLFGAVQPFGFGGRLGGGHVGLDGVDEGAEGVDGRGFAESLVVLIPHEAVVVDPVVLLLLEHGFEQLVRAGSVSDGRGGDAEQRVDGVVLGLDAGGLVPGDAMPLLVRFSFDLVPHAAVDGVREVLGQRLDSMVGVAARAGQAHEGPQGKDVGHAPGDGQVNGPAQVRFAVGVQVCETGGHDGPLGLFDERLHVGAQPTVMFDGIKPSHDVPPAKTATVCGDRPLIG